MMKDFEFYLVENGDVTKGKGARGDGNQLTRGKNDNEEKIVYA